MTSLPVLQLGKAALTGGVRIGGIGVIEPASKAKRLVQQYCAQ